MSVGDERTHQWIDAARRDWRVETAPGHLLLHGDQETVDIPECDWISDVSALPHGSCYIVRIATREREVGFVVSAEQAEPVLRHVGQWHGVGEPVLDEIVEDDAPERPLMWPKVSPLAVWAVICSSMVFVPILGLLPAVGTVVLLVLHRKRVRRSRAWSHSRALCRVAFVFLVSGLGVEVIVAAGCLSNWRANGDSFDRVVGQVQPIPNAACHGIRTLPATASLLAAEPFWKREIDWALLAGGLFVVIMSLSVHEAAHAISAWWLGDDFARRLGRVTLNPRAHIDPVGTILLPMILFISGAGVFGWARPVPVQVDRVPRPRRAHILISIAGPGSNLLLASASLALLLTIGCCVGFAFPESSVSGLGIAPESGVFSGVRASGFPLAAVFAAVCTILKLSFLVNVFLAMFNLIPIPPLDGSWVLQNLFPFTLGPIYERIRPYGLFLFLGLMYTGILEYLLLPALFGVIPGLLLLEAALPF